MPQDHPSRSRLPGQLDHGHLGQLLGYNLAQASIPTNNAFKRKIQAVFDLSKLEFSLLMLLDANPNVSPKKLMTALNLPAPNLSVLIDRLEKRGLLSRSRNDADRRSQHINLTDLGVTLCHALSLAIRDIDNEIFSGFSAAERALFIEMLGRIAHNRYSQEATDQVSPILMDEANS